MNALSVNLPTPPPPPPPPPSPLFAFQFFFFILLIQCSLAPALASTFLELSPRLACAPLLRSRQIPMSRILLALMQDPYRCLSAEGGRVGGRVGALHRRHRSLSWNAHKPQVGIRQIHANRFPRPANPPLLRQ